MTDTREGRQDPGPRYGEMPGQLVPAIGTRRRLQALVVVGWSLTKLAERLDLAVANMITSMNRGQVAVSTHRTVSDLFESLWNQTPPNTDWHDKAAYTRAKNYAKARGWLPPLAWDDMDTDPAPETEEPAEQTKGERIIEDLEWLLDAGESPAQILTTLGLSAAAISKLSQRYKRPELARLFWNLDKKAA